MCRPDAHETDDPRPDDPASSTSGASASPGDRGGPRRAPRPFPPKRDRRALYGALIFFGLILVCFGFALILITAGDGGFSEDGPRIGVVEIRGAITGADKALSGLRRFRKDETIKAVLVRIDSPGGAVGPSQEIYRELVRLREKKPVVASMETVAASGGYYIAAGATKIVANRGTITGSIGVITQATEIAELLRLARVNTEVFKTGKYKDTMSPLRPLREDEKVYLQRLVDAILGQFVADVAKGRKLPVAKVKASADGRIFTGEEAKGIGLVDELGNFSDALELAAKLAKAEGDPVPVFYRPRKGLLQEMLGDPMGKAADSLREALRSRHAIELRAPRL